MEPDSMELKVISCKDLKAFNFFQKLNIYVVVSIVNEDNDSTPSPTNNNNNEKKKHHHQQQKQKTPIDREGDGNPEWNHVMRFDLKDIISSSTSCSCLLLEFDLLSEGTILGDKTIGRVRVPFEDLINEFNGGAVRFVSYQVRTTDGMPNGVLDFSFKPIFIIHNNSNTTNFLEDNKYGNQPLAVANSNSNFNSNSNSNGGGGVDDDDDDVPLIYRPMPSTCYPPLPVPVPVPVDDWSYINPSSSSETHYPAAAIETHNPSPSESYYPKIDQFHNPSQEIHYPTHEIHSPPTEFHNPPSPPEVLYYPQPRPQFDYLLSPPPPPSPPYHHHHHHHPLPQVAYYPATPTPPLFYPRPPPPPPSSMDPYGHEFGRGNPNPNPNPAAAAAAAAYGYPNHWASTPPIHW